MVNCLFKVGFLRAAIFLGSKMLDIRMQRSKQKQAANINQSSPIDTNYQLFIKSLYVTDSPRIPLVPSMFSVQPQSFYDAFDDRRQIMTNSFRRSKIRTARSTAELVRPPQKGLWETMRCGSWHVEFSGKVVDWFAPALPWSNKIIQNPTRVKEHTQTDPIEPCHLDLQGLSWHLKLVERSTLAEDFLEALRPKSVQARTVGWCTHQPHQLSAPCRSCMHRWPLQVAHCSSAAHLMGTVSPEFTRRTTWQASASLCRQ